MTTITTHQPNPEDDITRCAHPGCSCEVEPGQAYCSSECEAQADNETCSCGHAGCMSEEQDPEGEL